MGASEAHGIGAGQEQCVMIGRIGRGPVERTHREQRQADRLEAKRLDAAGGRAVAGLGAEYRERPAHPANSRRTDGGARVSRSSASAWASPGSAILPPMLPATWAL